MEQPFENASGIQFSSDLLENILEFLIYKRNSLHALREMHLYVPVTLPYAFSSSPGREQHPATLRRERERARCCAEPLPGRRTARPLCARRPQPHSPSSSQGFTTPTWRSALRSCTKPPPGAASSSSSMCKQAPRHVSIILRPVSVVTRVRCFRRLALEKLRISWVRECMARLPAPLRTDRPAPTVGDAPPRGRCLGAQCPPFRPVVTKAAFKSKIRVSSALLFWATGHAATLV